jgi:hypothetical protein
MDCVSSEIADHCEKLLMPAANQHPAAIPKVIKPWLLVFDLKPKGPAIALNEMVKKAWNKAYKEIAVFFQHLTITCSGIIKFE